MASHSSLGHGSNLYITYPYGLLALKALCPDILRTVRNVYISGTYTTAKPAHNQRVEPMYGRGRRHNFLMPPEVSEDTAAAATHTLGKVVSTILGPEGHPTFRKLELRIFYPDEDKYSHVWGDDRSPAGIALKNIAGGDIDLDVWRGRQGTGVAIVARPYLPSRKVSTRWHRLGDTRKENESFVIGEHWGKE